MWQSLCFSEGVLRRGRVGNNTHVEMCMVVKARRDDDGDEGERSCGRAAGALMRSRAKTL